MKREWKGITENCVHMGIFDFSVIVLFGDYKTTLNYVAWKFHDKEGEVDINEANMNYAPRGECFFKRGYVPIIWIPKKPKTMREHATYAHECLHAIFHLFEWAGIPVTRDTEEVMTHAMAHLITNGIK